jgi:hypothetical protein
MNMLEVPYTVRHRAGGVFKASQSRYNLNPITHTAWFRRSQGGFWRLSLFGSPDLVAAVVILGGLFLWLVYGVVVTHRHPDDAARIIKATGLYFPLRMRMPHWFRRKP